MNTKQVNDIFNTVDLKNRVELILRKATADDAEDMLDYLNAVGGESKHLLFGANEFKLSIEQERAYIEKINQEENSLMLLGFIDHKIVSISQITSQKGQRINHNSELAISVKKEYWGNKIGHFAIEQLIKFAKNTHSIKNISLGVKADNQNAIKLYEKHGFVEIGVHKNYLHIDGEYYDEILMDLSI